jgi:hypothetical protein
VAKGSQLGGMRNAGSYPGSGSRVTLRCIGCKRRIAWGDRCEKCKQELARAPQAQAPMTLTRICLGGCCSVSGSSLIC